MSRLRDERGFSLVEMLVVTVILTIVMGGITTVFIQGSNAEIDMNSRFQAQVGARVGLDKLRRELHCASAASVTNSGATLTITDPCINATNNNVAWCTSGSGMRYGLYRATGSPAVCSSSSTKYADYLTNTSGYVFWYDGAWVGSLGKVTFDLKINVKPARTVNLYELCDGIVLRNATGVVTSAPATFPATTKPC